MHKEIQEIIENIKKLIESANKSAAMNVILDIEENATTIGRAFSGSWLGYHAHVYYRDFRSPPPGTRFKPEWGLKSLGFPLEQYSSQGDWVEYQPEHVITACLGKYDEKELSEISTTMGKYSNEYLKLKSDIESILYTITENNNDKYLSEILEDIKKQDLPTQQDILDTFSPKGGLVSRDMAAISQGILNPPHFIILSNMLSYKIAVEYYRKLHDIAEKIMAHVVRLSTIKANKDKIAGNIFIGHGQSKLWRDLKDFIQDRLHLPWDEFNRVPVAGITNITRLSDMLDSACIAFLILTAEDEMIDGNFHARMNVIHEAGLFQGRLGFARAIVVLEDGCEEFSNIEGLGQIRFPKENIKAIFEDIRAVLERERILND